MNANPFFGVVLHAIGGVAHGSFYVPLRKLRHWRWETGWLVQGLAAWVITPWLIVEITGTHPLAVLRQSPGNSMALAYLFGMMWGFGSLTFGLAMRYLGMSLGMAGGFTVNYVWCLMLNLRNHSMADYIRINNADGVEGSKSPDNVVGRCRDFRPDTVHSGYRFRKCPRGPIIRSSGL